MEERDGSPDALILDFIGTGDAFGSGGRLHTCFQIRTPERRVLLDCGASALIGLKRSGLDPALVDTIVLSHFHGDHFGGVPFLLRERQLREWPQDHILTVLGPAGTTARLADAAEAMFPGSTREWKSSIRILEIHPNRPYRDDHLTVSLLPVVHTRGTNPHAIRAEIGGRAICYSGDTEWTPSLYGLSDGADVFICECYSLQPKRNHMDYPTLLRHAGRLDCRKLFVTHMGPDVLEVVDSLGLATADEGGSLEVAP